MVQDDFTFRINSEFDAGNSAKQAESLAKSFDEIGSEAAEAAKGTEDLNESLGDTMRNAEKASKGLDGVADATKDSSDAIDVNVKSISSLSQTFANVTTIAGGVVGVFKGIVGGITGLVGSFEEAGFELGVMSAAMNNVKLATGATAKDIDNLTGFISELSNQSAVSEGQIGKVISRFTAFGLSQREAADAAVQTINVVRDSGREIDEVAMAFIDSFKGSAEGLQQLGVGIQSLTMEELLRGDAVKRISDLYGEQVIPIGRVDEFIGEIRAKWELLTKSVINSVAESKALQAILNGVSKVLSTAIANVPGFGALLDTAIKEAIAGAIELRANFIDMKTDVINTTLEIIALGGAVKSISQFATGRVISGAITGAGALIAGGARAASGPNSEDRQQAQSLRSLADDIRDGTKPLEDLVSDILGETGEGNAENLNALKDLLTDNKSGTVQQKAAAEAAKAAAKAQRETEEQIAKTAAEARLSLKENIQSLAKSNEDAIKSLNESELSGEIQVTSPELDLINDVLTSLQSGNEVRVADFEALRQLAIDTGQIGENERISAQELVMRMGTVREGILEQVKIQQRGFKEETQRYQEQRKLLISQRDTAAKSFAAMVKSLDLQRITFQKRAEQEGKDFSRQIAAIEAQKATAEAGFNNLTSGIDRGIAELDAEFSETRSQYQSISQREVANVVDIARKAAAQRDEQISATKETAVAAKEAAKASLETSREVEQASNTDKEFFNTINQNINLFAKRFNEGQVTKEELARIVESGFYGPKKLGFSVSAILREAGRIRNVNENILRASERQAIRDEQIRAEERSKAAADAARRPSRSTPSRSNQIGETIGNDPIGDIQRQIGILERALEGNPNSRELAARSRSDIRSEIASLQKELAAEIKRIADEAAAEREAARRRAEAGVNRIGGGPPGISSEDAARIAAEMAAEEARRRADEIAEQASKDAERLQASFDRQRERIEGEIEAARDRLEFLREQVDALREEVDITREIGEQRVALAQAFLDTEQAFLDEQRAQNLSARNAFNPFRDLDRQEERSIPLNVSIQLGDQRLADVLLNLQESGYGNILRAA